MLDLQPCWSGWAFMQFANPALSVRSKPLENRWKARLKSKRVDRRAFTLSVSARRLDSGADSAYANRIQATPRAALA